MAGRNSQIKFNNLYLFSSNTFFGYDPHKETTKSWWEYLKDCNLYSKYTTKAHFFQFDVWNCSMETGYLINAIVIITIGFLIQHYSNLADDKIVDQTQYSSQYYTLGAQLQSGTLSAVEMMTIYAKFQAIEVKLIQISDEVRDDFLSLLWIQLCLSCYLLQNITQIIFAKLRSKSIKIIVPEFILNFACTGITLYCLIWYYGHYKNMTVENEKFRSATIMSRICKLFPF